MRKALGPDHPKVATALNNLAQLLAGHEPAFRGRALYRRALAIDEKSLGPDHPEVAKDLNNLAELLQATNRLSEAEPLMRRALAIFEKSFGPDHPDVATSLNNLAELLQAHEPSFRGRAALCAARSPSMRKASAPIIPMWPRTSTIWRCCFKATNRSSEAEPLDAPRARHR